MMKRVLGFLCALLLTASSVAEPRPVDETGALQKLQFVQGRSEVIPGAGAPVFGAAQPGTTWYGGTIWAADSARCRIMES